MHQKVSKWNVSFVGYGFRLWIVLLSSNIQINSTVEIPWTFIEIFFFSFSFALQLRHFSIFSFLCMNRICTWKKKEVLSTWKNGFIGMAISQSISHIFSLSSLYIFPVLGKCMTNKDKVSHLLILNDGKSNTSNSMDIENMSLKVRLQRGDENKTHTESQTEANTIRIGVDFKIFPKLTEEKKNDRKNASTEWKFIYGQRSETIGRKRIETSE